MLIIMTVLFLISLGVCIFFAKRLKIIVTAINTGGGGVVENRVRNLNVMECLSEIKNIDPETKSELIQKLYEQDKFFSKVSEPLIVDNILRYDYEKYSGINFVKRLEKILRDKNNGTN